MNKEKDYQKNWSPWGDSGDEGFLRLPHKANRVLAYLGFSSSEILVVQGLMSWVRPGGMVSVSQSWLGEYAGVVINTVVRALQKMIQMGLEVKVCGGWNRLSTEYDTTKFVTAFQKAMKEFDVAYEKEATKKAEEKKSKEEKLALVRTSLAESVNV